MKGKIVAGLIAALLIVSVALFAGCVEKETPTEAGESTPTPEPTVEMTPEEGLTPGPEQTPSPTAEPVLSPGYAWYHDEEFGYKIAYPENWEKIDVIPAGEGMEGAVSFRDPGTPTNTIGVTITSEYDMEALKAGAEGGKEVVINGREGYEAILQPMSMVKMKLVVFAVGDRYYVVSPTTSADSFDEQTEMIDNVINSFVIE